MNSEIVYEINTFCKAIMLGVMWGVIYDILRVFRRVKKCKGLRMGIEDTAYWCIMSVILIMFLYHNNGGTIRAYVIAGIAIGMFLYELSIGRFVVKYLSEFLGWFNEKIKKFIGKIWKFIHWVLKKVFKPFKIIGNTLNMKIVKKIKLRNRGANIEKREKKRKCKKRQERT